MSDTTNSILKRLDEAHRTFGTEVCRANYELKTTLGGADERSLAEAVANRDRDVKAALVVLRHTLEGIVEDIVL